MLSLRDAKTTVAVLAGLSLAGALAGCSATTADPAPATPTEQPTTPPADSAPAETGSGAYADGTYSDTETYQSPNGTETIDVTLTLADDIITDVQVVGHGESPDSRHYQGQFIGGIAAVVVGKDIDEIQVSKVAGSSLTSGGFNKAVEAIKAEATA